MRLTFERKGKKNASEDISVQITRTGRARKSENLQFGFWWSFSAVLRRIQTVLKQV